MDQKRWQIVYLATACLMAAFALWLFFSIPEFKGETDWTGQLISGGWMAWSFPIALFFWTVACILIVFTLLAIRYPEVPRLGILKIETTRGDRLFITLLGSAFINMAWMGLTDQQQWQALFLCLVYAFAVFRFV